MVFEIGFVPSKNITVQKVIALPDTSVPYGDVDEIFLNSYNRDEPTIRVGVFRRAFAASNVYVCDTVLSLSAGRDYHFGYSIGSRDYWGAVSGVVEDRTGFVDVADVADGKTLVDRVLIDADAPYHSVWSADSALPPEEEGGLGDAVTDIVDDFTDALTDDTPVVLPVVNVTMSKGDLWKWLLVLLVVVLISGGLYWYYARRGGKK